MAKVVLIDSGPLVATLLRRDRHHDWARDLLGRLPPPFVTCEAVISETIFLLGSNGIAKESFLHMLERGALRLAPDFSGGVAELTRLMRRYADTPMSFADACLVRLSELHSDSVVLTLDSDFLVYRRNGRQRISTLMPR